MSKPSTDYQKLIRIFNSIHSIKDNCFWCDIEENSFSIIGADLQKINFIFNDDGKLIEWE